MKKKQVLATLALSAVVLAQAGFSSADEVTPVDPSAPSTEVVTPVEPSTPADTTDTTVPVDVTTTEQTTPVDPTTPSSPVPSGEPGKDTAEDSVDVPAPQGKDSSGNNLEVTDPSQSDQPAPSGEPGKDTAGDDVDVPSEQPKTTEQANQQGASQVGTVSSSTGQVVQNVTPEAPIQTNTGASIVSTQNGQVVLSDGSTVAPEAIGAVTNADKTITVTKTDGTKATLPETGEATSFLATIGTGLLGLVGVLFKKKLVLK
ncbi:LPXTG cell wall anchor domain-containing protein [Streptococcus sp. S784/96/1]|uniref:LPXTG cell wall anchor domain-containing protein n=1 Tax=Streptococcus sp. S784/96/1 TaxID=2653499 RepID=UPI0013895135|nr:LPXTG cell wall anchor domain-containing protein [Streptococcus sp. S784/96/1]